MQWSRLISGAGLSLHQEVNTTDHSITSSNFKILKQTFSENAAAWKVFESKVLHIGHLNINSILPRIKQLRSLLVNTKFYALRITKTKFDSTVNNEEVKINGCNLI